MSWKIRLMYLLPFIIAALPYAVPLAIGAGLQGCNIHNCQKTGCTPCPV